MPFFFIQFLLQWIQVPSQNYSWTNQIYFQFHSSQKCESERINFKCMIYELSLFRSSFLKAWYSFNLIICVFIFIFKWWLLEVSESKFLWKSAQKKVVESLQILSRDWIYNLALEEVIKNSYTIHLWRNYFTSYCSSPD